MTRRFEILCEPGLNRSALLTIDGELLDNPPTLVTEEYLDTLIPGVWLDGERIYDVEVWMNGRPRIRVPARSPEVDRCFEEHEARQAAEQT
jgi:hypothetical protein